MLKILVLFGLYIGFVYPRYFIVGPAGIRVISLVSCPEYSKLPGQCVLNRRMFNETTEVYDGFVNFPIDFDDNVTLDVKCSRIDRKKTQVNSFVLNDAPVCHTLTQYVGDLWTDIQSQIGMEPGVCPIKMGNYTLNNVVIDLGKLNVQMILEGVFKSRVLIKNNTKPLFCGDYTFELFPKKQ